MHHRGDIEALRALAVSVVLVFHALPWALPGGFLGVDVFFVVSGYLITLLLIREYAATGRISWGRFYAKRVRRLAPSLAVVLAVVLVIGWWMLLPMDYAATARTAAAAALGLSNVELGWNNNYFGPGVDRNPLAHTWSLGVEEQFYIVWPVLVAFSMRLGVARSWPLVAILAVGGFGWALWVFPTNPSWAYFRTDARVWQLASGALLAYAHTRWPGAASKCAGWVCVVALAVLSASFIWIDKTMVHPGWATLPVVLATVALLHTGALVSCPVLLRRVLGPSIAFLGRISYALYLVHWPVFVFATLRFGHSFGWWEAVMAIAVSVCLAWALHVGVEVPLRRSKAIPTPRVVRLSLVGLCLLACMSSWVWMLGGVPARVGDAIRSAEVYVHPFRTLTLPCHFDWNTLDDRPCVFEAGGASQQAPTWAVLGDSHASSLTSGLLDTDGIDPFLALSVSGCPLISGPERHARLDCARFPAFVLSQLEKYPSVRVVVVHLRWSYYGFDDEARLFGPNGPLQPDEVFARIGAVVSSLEDSGYQVVLVGPVPEQEKHVLKTLASRMWYGRDITSWGIDRATFDARHQEFRSWAATRAEPIVWPEDTLCDEHMCAAVSPSGEPFYFDDDHLSVLGARRVALPVWNVVKPLLH